MPVSHATEKLNAQFNRAIISEHDFTEAENYLICFDQKPTDVIKRALLLAAIVSYARPFLNSERETQSQAISQLSIKPSKVLLPGELELHKKVMSLRNEALAHSQYTRKPVARSSGSENGFSFQGRPYDLLSENIDVERFLSLCRKLKVYCMSKSFKLNDHIIKTPN